MLKQMKEPDSEFKNYMDSIPKTFEEFPFFYKGKDRKLIKKSFLENDVKNRQKYLKSLIALINRSKLKGQYTTKEIKNAYNIVQSRNFGVYFRGSFKSYTTMIPIIDLFNYSPKKNTIWSGFVENENDFFTLNATKTIKKGEEIFVNYGNNDNIHILYAYGFTLKNNPFPVKRVYFQFKFNGKKESISLDENESSNFIFFTNLKRNWSGLSKENAKLIRKKDTKLFEEILKNLKTYSNKKRLHDLKNNINETSNTLNIYRALKAEDVLIDKNIKHLKDIIKILKKGKKAYEENINSKVVKQNQHYFQVLFD